MSNTKKVMLHTLEAGDQFEYEYDTYVCGRYSDERSINVTRLKDGKQKCFISSTYVVIESASYPIEKLEVLKNFINPQQLSVMIANLAGEEGEFFVEKLDEVYNTVTTMPVTYGQDGKGDNAIAYLHYFQGSYDFYMTEKDMEEEQLQSFGLIKNQCTELGYVSLVEILDNGVELDLYFEPTRIAELK